MPAPTPKFEVFESSPAALQTLLKLEPAPDGSVDLWEVTPEGNTKWALLRFKDGKVYRHRGVGNTAFSLDAYGRIRVENLFAD